MRLRTFPAALCLGATHVGGAHVPRPPPPLDGVPEERRRPWAPLGGQVYAGLLSMLRLDARLCYFSSFDCMPPPLQWSVLPV